MLEWARLTDEELDRLDRELPVVVPIGLVEAHGPALPLGLDLDSAEHFARQACAAAGAILMPPIAYGYRHETRDYPGTVGVRPETLMAMVSDLCESICAHGFRKIVFIAGDGASVAPVELGFARAWERYPDLKPACWAWWKAADLTIHHADEIETAFALLIGSTVHLDRARDATFDKPWHLVYSRRSLAPNTGGVNGRPSRADANACKPAYARVVQVLVERLESAKADRTVVA
jgi:creatinine amidohydrolase